MWELSLLGISHILFGIILMVAKKKERSDFVLIFWLCVLMMPFLQHFFESLGFQGGIMRLNNQAFTLLNGPFLYLYMREVTKRDNASIRYLPHFLLFFLFYISLIIKPAPLQPGGPSGPYQDDFSVFRYFGFISLFVFMLYAFYSLGDLRRHRKSVKESFAYRSGEITLFWLSLLPVLFITLLLIIVLFENFSNYAVIDAGFLHFVIFLVFALYLIFFGLRQKKIYPDPDRSESPGKAKKSSVAEEGATLFLERIRDAMEEEKLYLNPVLSVYDLALAAGISRHRISSLLNENLSMNFFQFVNRYRLEEVCCRLRDDRENRQNILELAYDSGFNSKSSFNSLFKEHYGMTPSQYKKSVQIQ